MQKPLSHIFMPWSQSEAGKCENYGLILTEEKKQSIF